MGLWTKKEMVDYLYEYFYGKGYEISRQQISRAFTYSGTKGNRQGSRELYGVCTHLADLGISGVLSALRNRGVVFKDKKAVVRKPVSQPSHPRSQPSDSEEWALVCPECGALDPQRPQASRCPHCEASVDHSLANSSLCAA